MGELYVKQGDEWVPVVKSGTQPGPQGPQGPQGLQGPPGPPFNFGANSIYPFSYQKQHDWGFNYICGAGTCQISYRLLERKSSNWNTNLPPGTWQYFCYKIGRLLNQQVGTGGYQLTRDFDTTYDVVSWTVVSDGSSQTVGSTVLTNAAISPDGPNGAGTVVGSVIITSGTYQTPGTPLGIQDWARTGYCIRIGT